MVGSLQRGALPSGPGLSGETPAETEDAVPKLLALVVTEELVPETLIEALQARVVGLCGVVRLLVGGRLRGCARLTLTAHGVLAS